MAVTTHLVDTGVLIHALRGPSRALGERLLEHDGRMAVSTISVTELTYGALRAVDPETALIAVQELLAELEVLPLDQAGAAEAGVIRAELAARGTPIGPYDGMIAAQARAAGLILATGNVREFRRVRGLAVENWRR